MPNAFLHQYYCCTFTIGGDSTLDNVQKGGNVTSVQNTTDFKIAFLPKFRSTHGIIEHSTEQLCEVLVLVTTRKQAQCGDLNLCSLQYKPSARINYLLGLTLLHIPILTPSTICTTSIKHDRCYYCKTTSLFYGNKTELLMANPSCFTKVNQFNQICLCLWFQYAISVFMPIHLNTLFM